MAQLLSVNIGVPRPLPGRKSPSGIDKRPQAGPVCITREGLAGDAVVDRRHHGGAEQAVYCYFADDYDFWAGQLDQAPTPGLFGENLTIAGVVGAEVAVGDRFAIGEVVLEVNSHRTPCATFGARMGDMRFVKTFARAGRPGAYCRVLAEGEVEAGMDIAVTRFAGERVTVAELLALDGKRVIAEPVLRRALAAPIHAKMRADYEKRLNQIAV
jgi:MOSC domain-containing protein YiiM